MQTACSNRDLMVSVDIVSLFRASRSGEIIENSSPSINGQLS